VHELAITQELLALTLQVAQESEAQQVNSVQIHVGQFAGIEDESMRFYWQHLAEGTIAADARLIFTHLPARIHCTVCGTESKFDAEVGYCCTSCHSFAVQMVGGDELRLESIEID
jgi:hydrogenase nickel incorporation protein HypA/HybF